MNILNFHTFFYYDNTEWGQFGTYDMEIAADGKSMKGSYVGYPDDWRSGSFTRKHTEEESKKLNDIAAHNHAHDHTHEHSHDHDGNCNDPSHHH